MGIRHTVCGVLAIGYLLAADAAGAASDPLIEGARQCTLQFPVQERGRGIPNHLLAAISSTESGRWHEGLGMALPWPWTINVEGKGYYFASKAEAIAKTQSFLRNGARSIDVGCMQVNLKHHPNAFRTLDEAFDPATNVGYAAQFLRTNYNDLGDWIKATAAYHSRTPRYGNQYLARIEKNWNRIVSRVAQARKNQGLEPQPVMAADFSVADAGENAPTGNTGRRMNPIATTRNQRVITVSEQPARRVNDVLVVHQQAPSAPSATAPATIRIADANDSGLLVTRMRGVAVKTPGVDRAAASANSAHAGSEGPKFVFAN